MSLLFVSLQKSWSYVGNAPSSVCSSRALARPFSGKEPGPFSVKVDTPLGFFPLLAILSTTFIITAIIILFRQTTAIKPKPRSLSLSSQNSRLHKPIFSRLFHRRFHAYETQGGQFIGLKIRISENANCLFTFCKRGCANLKRTFAIAIL